MVAEALLTIRVCALYHFKTTVKVTMCSIWVAQLCFMAFTLAHSGPVIIPPSPLTYGCILVADPKIGALLIMWTVPSLVFDTITISLIVYGVWEDSRAGSHMPLPLRILQDGLLYFLVNFASTLVWTILGLTLPTDLKNVWSFPSTVLTNILIGRITLSLREPSSLVVSSGGLVQRNELLNSAQYPNTTGTGFTVFTEMVPLEDRSTDAADVLT